MTESEEPVQLRRKLLKLDKNEVAKKCKRKNLSTGGTKSEMVDRLVQYNEDNGGVTGAHEGSKKNTKKGNDSGSKKKSGNKKKSGGASGAKSGSSKRNNGGTSGRTNKQNNNDNEAQCYCNCGGGDNDDDESINNRRLFGGVLGAICAILFIVAMAMNALSRVSSTEFTVTCRHHEVRGCFTDTNCITVSYNEDCDQCTLNNEDECNTCDTKRGGKWWLAMNIIALIVLLIGVIGIFVVHFAEKGHAFLQWIKLFYIISAILSFIAVIAWVSANGYNQSCYDPTNDLGLGASTIIDIINGLLLVIGAILVF